MAVIQKILRLLVFIPSFALADDFFDLPLDELLNINISTVSKRVESSLDAPGIVSVITAQEIKTFGARNIKDVLQRTTNLYIADSTSFLANTVSMRAGASQHLNNHTLYLINGRPIRESQNGGLHTDINLIMPVEAIERIEIIRGPGSVLYGSNAFSGVINFITKTAKENVAGSLSYQYGTHGFKNYSASAESNLNGDGNIYAIINSTETDGEIFSATDEVGIEGSRRQVLDGESAVVNISYKGLTLNTIHSDSTMPLFSGPFQWATNADFQYKRAFYDVGYTHHFNKRWYGSLNYTYNKTERFITGPGPSSSEFLSNGYLYEATLYGELTSDLNLISGVVVDYIRGDLFNRGGTYRNKRTGYYSQLDYRVTDKAKVTGGFQSNQLEGHSAEISPRLALNYHFNKSWSSKLLYSEAFRSPYGSEYFFDAVFLQGDEELESETITTYEAQLIYSQRDYFLEATYYQSQSEKMIGRAIVNGKNTFVNEDGEITFDGFELEGNWNVTNQWRLQGNYSYQSSEDETGEKNATLSPRQMLKLGLSYQSEGGYSVGLWNSYIGDVSKAENQTGNSTLVVNPSADAVNLLSLNFNANVGRFFDMPTLNKLDFSVYANNLLGEEVYFPELGRKRVNTYPQSSVRGVYATLKVSF